MARERSVRTTKYSATTARELAKDLIAKIIGTDLTVRGLLGTHRTEEEVNADVDCWLSSPDSEEMPSKSPELQGVRRHISESLDQILDLIELGLTTQGVPKGFINVFPLITQTLRAIEKGHFDNDATGLHSALVHLRDMISTLTFTLVFAPAILSQVNDFGTPK